MLELNEAILHCHFRTNCRVTRHRISTKSQLHGTPAEIKPDSTIDTQGEKQIHSLGLAKKFSVIV
jgi:hypothetical protein